MLRTRIINKVGRIWNDLNVPPSLRYLQFDILYAAYYLFRFIGGINYPRLIEWKYVLKNLPDYPSRILDVGSTTSLFPFKLHSLGHYTHCLDQREPNFEFPKGIIFHKDNLMELKIDSDFFDVISCISVIEHVGLGRYNDPKSDEGDMKAVREMLRILKPSGRLIITTNVCNKSCFCEREIRYGRDKLERILSIGKLFDIEYRYFNGRNWLLCDSSRAFSGGPEDFGLVMFTLTK